MGRDLILDPMTLLDRVEDQDRECGNQQVCLFNSWKREVQDREHVCDWILGLLIGLT